MTPATKDRIPEIWAVPECPFSIASDPDVLEEIRCAVVDAFFAVPHGGLEIGGILLGRFEREVLRIAGHQPFACEHAAGPSLTLSERDHHALSEQLAGLKSAGDGNLLPVGWYHSHTRGEISLSDADLDIYRRYFPEPWQVALVLRPASMRPTRAAFFFRRPDGTIRSDASYREFLVLARVSATARVPTPPPAPEVAAPAIATAPQPAPAESARPVRGAAEAPLPQFLSGQPPSAKQRLRMWIWVAAALLLSSAAGASVYWKDFWIHKLLPNREVPLTLQVLDADGQMRILWNPLASAVQQARSGTLDIVDGPDRNSIVLDANQLRGGTFHYARRLEIVHLRLTLHDGNGSRTEASTSYLGMLPSRAAASRDVEIQSANQALQQQVETISEALQREQARARWMEKVIIDLRRENSALKGRK